VSTWLNAGVPAPQVAEWAGHSVEVLLKVYARCIVGQDEAAKRRISDALNDEEPPAVDDRSRGTVLGPINRSRPHTTAHREKP
jgi:hypothetical protein